MLSLEYNFCLLDGWLWRIATIWREFVLLPSNLLHGAGRLFISDNFPLACVRYSVVRAGDIAWFGRQRRRAGGRRTYPFYDIKRRHCGANSDLSRLSSLKGRRSQKIRAKTLKLFHRLQIFNSVGSKWRGKLRFCQLGKILEDIDFNSAIKYI